MTTTILDGLIPGMASLAVRATLLLAGALVIGWALRRGPAAARHALWTATALALLALPVLPGVLPDLRVPLPSLEMRTTTGVLSTGQRLPPSRSPIDPGRMAAGTAEVAELTTGDAAPLPAATEAGVERSEPAGWTTALALLWLAGGLLVAGSLALGLWRVRRIVAGAETAAGDDSWSGPLAAARDRLGIRRPVRLGYSPAIDAPMTGGLLRPVVLLPEEAKTWSGERRELVLLHELVHVARADVPRQVLGRLATAIYWFHPFAWIAAREAVLAREQACDETVLALGHRPSTYARHLLELSRPAAAPVAALSLIERSHLEKRLMSILGPSRSPRPWMGAAAALSLCVWTATVAGAAPASPASDDAAGASSATSRDGDGGATAGASRAAASSGTAAIPLLVPAEGEGRLSHPRGLVEAPLSPPSRMTRQETSCFIDRMEGDFSGTYSSYDREGERVIDVFGWNEGRRRMQKRLDDMTLCMLAEEGVRFDDEGRVESVPDGASVVYGTRVDGRTLELEVRGEPGGDEHTLRIDGQARPFDAAAAAWRDALVPVLAGYWDIARIRGEVSTLRGEISTIRGERSSLRGEISSIRGRVSSLRGEISSVRGRESSLKGEISSIRGQLSSLRGEISSIRGHESSLRGRISGLEGRISGLRSARRATADDDTRRRLESEITDLERDIEEVQREIAAYDADARVAEVERRIAEFDADARVREVEERLRAWDTEARVREIERRIEEFDAEAKVREIERRIEALDVEGRVGELEDRIEALDADRRIDAIEARLEPEVRRLREAVSRLR